VSPDDHLEHLAVSPDNFSHHLQIGGVIWGGGLGRWQERFHDPDSMLYGVKGYSGPALVQPALPLSLNLGYAYSLRIYVCMLLAARQVFGMGKSLQCPDKTM
jgi:hypothetical protein